MDSDTQRENKLLTLVVPNEVNFLQTWMSELVGYQPLYNEFH